MKKIISKLVGSLAIVALVLGCAMTPLEKQNIQSATSTIGHITKGIVTAVCLIPEANQALIHDRKARINEAVAPASISIACPTDGLISSDIQQTPPSVAPLANIEQIALRGITKTYCNDSMIGDALIKALNVATSPATFTITCAR